MDTKSKKFKRGLVKVLCIVLSLVCIGTAVLSALNVLDFAVRAGYFYGIENFRDTSKKTLYDPRISSDFLREIGFSYYAIKRNLITYQNGAVFEGEAAKQYLENRREQLIQEQFESFITDHRVKAQAYNSAEKYRRENPSADEYIDGDTATTYFDNGESESVYSSTITTVPYYTSYYDENDYISYAELTLEDFEDNEAYIIDEYGYVSVNDDYFREMAENSVNDSGNYDLERYENEYKHLKSYLAQLKSLEYFVVNNSTGEVFTNSVYKTSAEFAEAYENDTWFVSSDDNFSSVTVGYEFEQISRNTESSPGYYSFYGYYTDNSDIAQTKEGIILNPSAYTYEFFTLIRYGYSGYMHTASHSYVIGSTDLFEPDPFTVYLSFDYSRGNESDPFTEVYSRYINSVSRLETSISVCLISLALVLVILGVFFLVSGKGYKRAPAKLRHQDKIPGEIHFLVSMALFVGAFALAVVLAVQMTDYYDWRILITIACVALAVVGYSAVLNYVASFNRRRLNKTLFDNLIILWPFKLLRRIYHRLSRNSSQLKDGVRRHFKFFVPFYAVISVVCWFMLVSDSALIILGFVGLVLANIAMLVIIYAYAKSLDKIRDTVSQAQQGNFDVEFDCASMPTPMVKLAHEIEDMRSGMKQAIDTAVQDQRTKTELITNVSHDLKTPLTSIITYTDLIRRSNIEDEAVRGYADVLAEKSQRLKQLIEDLTEATKASTGAVDLQLVDVDLYELAMQAVGENEDRLEQQKIDVRFTPVNGTPIVRADGQKTYRVFENIISNITKYALTDTVAYVMVGVQDGYGTATFKNISAAPLNVSPEQLMERFVRGDASRSGEGSGLGLSIARDLCTLQGGSFEIYIDGDMFTAKVALPLSPDIEKYIQPPIAEDTKTE